MIAEYLSYMGHALFVSVLFLVTWFSIVCVYVAWDGDRFGFKGRLFTVIIASITVNTTGFVIYKYITAAAV